MTRIALVGPEMEENLSLRSLAASLIESGFTVDIVRYDGEQQFTEVLDRLLGGPEQPALIGVTLSFQWRAQDCLALVVALRQRGFAGHVTGGGHFGTFAAEAILADFPELDSIVRHEAEETLVELARAVTTGEPWCDLHGLAVRDTKGRPRLNPIRRAPALDRLPAPDRRGEPVRCLGHGVAPLIGSRGCYANCAFCCIAAWHEAASPGKRFRVQPVEQIADEMVALQRERGVDIFIFHDDNFFLPGHGRSLERIHRLADALSARGMGRFATVVKARPNDVTPEVFAAMRDRLGCVRVFLGIESDADQGIATLRRATRRAHHEQAMATLAELGLYVCFNLLIFDPDTSVDSLAANLRFMSRYAEVPFNFGRVELYAGTPLLARMQAEGRCHGDYLAWNYDLATPEVQRIFEIAMHCFRERNFGGEGLAYRLMGTRFDVEVARHFHPETYRPRWLETAEALSRELATGSVAGLQGIIAWVESHGARADALALEAELRHALRAQDAALAARATTLETEIQTATGRRCQHLLPAVA